MIPLLRKWSADKKSVLFKKLEAFEGEWRPWNHSHFSNGFRSALRTMLILAKAQTLHGKRLEIASDVARAALARTGDAFEHADTMRRARLL